MPCTHRLFGEPTGLVCTCVGEHRTHVYQASDAPDRHTATEGMQS